MKSQDEIIEIFAGELWKAILIKELLKENGIVAYLENELMGTIAPWYISSGGADPVRLKILSSDYVLSKELIDGLTIQENSSPDEA
jgi:hypothetical protein